MRKKNHAKIRANRVIRQAVASMPGVTLKRLTLGGCAYVRLSPPGSSYELDVRVDYNQLADAAQVLRDAVSVYTSAAGAGVTA